MDEKIGANKGALHIEIDIPGVGVIDFYVSHLGAVYPDRDSVTGYNEDQMRIRYNQVNELIDYINRTKKHGVQIITADLNTHPVYFDSKNNEYSETLTKEYKILTNEASFIDVFHLFNNIGSKYSFDSVNNYNAKNGEGANKEIIPEFIDYIFINKNENILPYSSKLQFTNDNVQISNEACSNILLENCFFGSDRPSRIPPSDHYGVLATFKLIF